jgi:GH35 family endo-1,4-beta-xylanase
LEGPAQAAIAGVAAILLFWGLTDKYLWQDEAATAVRMP